MKITKNDKLKLEIFYHYLNLYLADWESKNFFYFADCHQRDLTAEIINAKSLTEANAIYQDMDADDKSAIKDMLSAKEIEFKASKDKPLHYYKFKK